MLTDLEVRALAPRDERYDERVGDPKRPGLVVRVTPSGAKTWVLRYRNRAGAPRRLKLGRYPAVTLADARRRADDELARVRLGADPQGERVKARQEAGRASGSLGDVAERWLREGRATKGERRGQPWRSKTRVEFERLVRGEIVPALGDMKPEAVTKREIRAFYDRLEVRSPSVAKHALAVLRLLYTWAAEEDHIDAVPLFPKRGTQSIRRKRVLEEDELRRVWRALEAGIGKDPKPERAEPMAEAFKLMLLTAQRRGEVLSMRWSDLTEEEGGVWWTIPAERHKGGRDHRVPLTMAAVEGLKKLHEITGTECHLFPAPKANAKTPHVSNPQKAAERLWSVCGVKDATLHDLRRTAATFMTRLEVPRLLVGKILGHADTDVTGRYDKHAYDREKRASLTKWADELQRIVSEERRAPAGKVLPWSR